MIYTVKINNKEYEVEVERGKATINKVTEASTQNTPAVVAAPTVQPSAPSPSNTEGGKVVSPMPGTILDIKVTEGKQVKKGELLVVLEAMKMENEIFAPHDGVIGQIFVTKGATVNTNDTILTIR